MTNALRKKTLQLLIAAAVALLVLAWIVYFHNTAVASHLPSWHWLQQATASLGQRVEAPAPEDDDPDNTKNEIPIHIAHVSVATLHRYVEGFGTVGPRPAASANIVAPVTGVVMKIYGQLGQKVHAGDPLIQLDDRLAKAAVAQGQAALDQAQTSLDALKAGPTANQLQIAELTVQKAQAAADLAQKNSDRVKQLAAAQITAAKNLEQAAQDLTAAQDDLTIAQRQLDTLKNTPSPLDLRQENAKVAQAAAQLASAKIQADMLLIAAPIDGTIAAINVNAGDGADTTRTLMELVALDRLMVDVDVPADQLPADAANLDAQICSLTPAQPTPAPVDEPPLLTAKVTSVSPRVDPKTGAIQLTINLPPDAPLRPGLFVSVRIIAEEHKNVLAVPREAVVADENGDSVIALIDGEQATHKHVKIGLEENGLIEIAADGLKEGDTVANAGAYGLPQATRVKVIP